MGTLARNGLREYYQVQEIPISQLGFTCLKATIETLEGVKYVQS